MQTQHSRPLRTQRSTILLQPDPKHHSAGPRVRSAASICPRRPPWPRKARSRLTISFRLGSSPDRTIGMATTEWLARPTIWQPVSEVSQGPFTCALACLTTMAA